MEDVSAALSGLSTHAVDEEVGGAYSLLRVVAIHGPAQLKFEAEGAKDDDGDGIGKGKSKGKGKKRAGAKKQRMLDWVEEPGLHPLASLNWDTLNAELGGLSPENILFNGIPPPKRPPPDDSEDMPNAKRQKLTGNASEQSKKPAPRRSTRHKEGKR